MIAAFILQLQNQDTTELLFARSAKAKRANDRTLISLWRLIRKYSEMESHFWLISG